MISDAHPTTRTIGTLRSADGAGVVRIEERYDTDPSDLWSALTDPDRLARWYGYVEGDLRAGGQFHLRIDGPDLDATGRVIECDAPSSLRVHTRETDESAGRGEGEPFEQTIDVTLTPDGDSTVLVIEVAGLPLGKIGAYGVGWQLNAESLGHYIDGRAAPDVAARWAELDEPYRVLAAQIT